MDVGGTSVSLSARGDAQRIIVQEIRLPRTILAVAIGAILGGAFAPTIAQAIVQATGSTVGVTWYLAGMTALGLIATLLLRDRSGIPLGPDHETEQAKSPIYGVTQA